MSRLSYSQRAQRCQNPTAKQLFQLMDEKKTNLTVAADVTSAKELLSLADQLGPQICLLKTHIDILEDFEDTVVQSLQTLAEKHRFLLFEDRKFADIGQTVRQQYQNGIYRIVDWAHLTNAHALPGPGIVEGLKTVGLPKGRGLLLLAEMSSKGAMTNQAYVEATVSIALENPNFVIGFITQKKLCNDPTFIHLTPGVHLSHTQDLLGQQYHTPEVIIGEQGCDVIIVGRGITQAKDPIEAAVAYREAGWKAYTRRENG